MNTRNQTEPTPSKREVFGITYERLRLDILFKQLIQRHGIRTVLELPAGGAKAMPSIYSLAWARHGAAVTLFNPEPQGLAVWDRLGLPYEVATGESPRQTGLDPDSFDVVWNFVTVGFDPDFEQIIGEMGRLAARFVMTVHVNGYNVGYPWHRFLHWAFRLPWTHGQTDYFFPRNVQQTYRERGIEPVDLGLLDMPPWPDPPGFRDIRLHLAGGDDVGIFDWSAPIEDIYAGAPVPVGLRVLSFIEDLPIPKLVRWPFSHLFYVLGECAPSR